MAAAIVPHGGGLAPEPPPASQTHFGDTGPPRQQTQRECHGLTAAGGAAGQLPPARNGPMALPKRCEVTLCRIATRPG